MEKIDIHNFRTDIEKRIKIEIPNINLISNLLISKGLVIKRFGLCAEPFNKYFSICNTNKRGVSCDNETSNTIHAVVNYNTSTRKRKIYFCSIQINYIDNFYYLCCLAQSAYYKKSTGAKHIVYKATEHEISIVLDEIFKDVEP